MHCQKLKILSQRQAGFIGVREGHNLVHLRFNNIMLNFSFTDFLSFRRMTKSLMRNECRVLLPDGSEKVVLKTPYQGVNFLFSEREICSLVSLMDEAYYFQQIYSLLNNN